MGEPELLTADEYALFRDLRDDRLGPQVRLEQERISFARVQRFLRQVQV